MEAEGTGETPPEWAIIGACSTLSRTEDWIVGIP
jgi:hypothetical protein